MAKYKTLEIYYEDLKEEAQKRVMEFYELQTEEEGEFDSLPLAILEIELGEEDGIAENTMLQFNLKES